MVGERTVSHASAPIALHRPAHHSAPIDMKKQFVYDPLISKRQQYLLATQVRFPLLVTHTFRLTKTLYLFQLVRAVLKIGACTYFVPNAISSDSVPF